MVLTDIGRAAGAMVVSDALLGGCGSARRGPARAGQGSQWQAQLRHGARGAPAMVRATKDSLDGDNCNFVGGALPMPVG